MPNHKRHDRELLDTLEGFEATSFNGSVWRVVRHGRDPRQGSLVSARWNPPNSAETLYTSLDRKIAIAEIYYHLSLAPIFPSVPFKLYKLDVTTKRTLRLDSMALLERLGVNEANYTVREYARTQAIGAAAHFLTFDGLIVPSARGSGLNLVLFLDQLDPSSEMTILDEEILDWRGLRDTP